MIQLITIPWIPPLREIRIYEYQNITQSKTIFSNLRVQQKKNLVSNHIEQILDFTHTL
jgi:hypothetical protein